LVLLGVEKMKYLPLVSLIGRLIFVVLVLLFINKPSHYIYILMFESIALLIANVLSFSFIIAEYSIQLKWIPFSEVKKYLYTNKGAFISLFIPSMLSNTAIFLVGWFGLPSQVSIIQLGVKVSNAFSTVNSILTQVFYTMLNRVKDRMKLSFLILITTGLFLTITMYFSANFIIKHWLKINDDMLFDSIVSLVQLLSPIPLFMGLISSFNINGLIVFDKDTLAGSITLLTVLVALMIALMFLPSDLILGGALFLLVARGLNAILSVIFFVNKKMFKQIK